MERILIYISIVLACISVGLSSYQFLGSKSSGDDKVVYVEPGILYKEYEGKPVYDTLFEEDLKPYEDSLKMISEELNTLGILINSGDESKQTEFESLRVIYMNKTKQYSNIKEQLEGRYISELLAQINKGVQDYGREKGYHHILGAEGSGTLMYADSTLNITEDVLLYLNKRYREGTLR